MPRQIYDSEGHAHFITFSYNGKRNFLHLEKARQIVIGVLNNELKQHNGLCYGFVIMPNHVHLAILFQEDNILSKFMHGLKKKAPGI